jgi:aldose 1-epimerase
MQYQIQGKFSTKNSSGEEESYQIDEPGETLLHAGTMNMHRRNWDAEIIENGVRFTLISPDGDCGWPGTVKFVATYSKRM